MKYKLTDQILLFLADWLDFNNRFTWRNFSAMPGDPRLHYHRRWLEKYLENQYKKQKLYTGFRTLKRSGFIQKKLFNNSVGYILSKRGQQKILYLKIKRLKKKKNKNGEWLMVFFDVPEKLRKRRDIFRKNLHELGFEQLQKSVWVTPYDVTGKLRELIEICGLEKFVKFLLVKEIQK